MKWMEIPEAERISSCTVWGAQSHGHNYLIVFDQGEYTASWSITGHREMKPNHFRDIFATFTAAEAACSDHARGRRDA